MIRRLLTLPLNLVALILALPVIVLIRAVGRARSLERKISMFEQGKKNKRRK